MNRLLFLIPLSVLLLFVSSGGYLLGADSTIRTSPLGYSISLTQEDAKEFVTAGRDKNAALAIPNPIFPTKVLDILIMHLGQNKNFKKEVEAKNGPAGVTIEVWGSDQGIWTWEGSGRGSFWFQSDIEKRILPESWHKSREMSRAARYFVISATVKPNK